MSCQVESDLASISGEWNKQYSAAYYARMKYGLGASDQVVERAIDSNNLRWVGEYVFGINYHEYFLQIEKSTLLSPDFGNRSLVEMCNDAVTIREKAGVDLARAESEKLGVEKLELSLGKMREGQTAVLISPPDPNDKNMAGYNMIYIYEKQKDGKVRATAVRDDISKIEDLRVLAGNLSGVMPKWKQADHLQFISSPIVTKLSFDGLVEVVGIRERDDLPSWVNDLSNTVTQAMLYELSRNNLEEVKRIFDAFQMTVKIRFEQDKEGAKEQLWIDPMRMIGDEKLWMRVQRVFLAVGGMEMIQAGGSCGAGNIGLKQDGWKDNNVLSELMGVNESEKFEESYSFDHEGQCVVCKNDPRMLGPCNICEQCDHKIRQQAE